MQPSIQVFELPELACIITSQLNKKALTCLMLTSRGMHETIKPWFYYELRTYSNNSSNAPKGLNINLCDSPDGLRALSRNIQFVKTWECDLYSLVFISRATAAVQQYLDDDNNNGSANNGNSSGMELDVFPAPLLLFLTWTKDFRRKRQLITPAITFDLLRLIPLPPVLALSRLSLSLPLFSKDNTLYRNFSHTLPSHSSLHVTISRVCAILSRLPQLLELTLGHLSVNDPRCLQLLTSTLLKMTTLRRLELDVVWQDGIADSSGVAFSLFFGSPPLIEKLLIEFLDYPDDHDTDDDSGGFTSGDDNNDTPIDDPGDDISVKAIQTAATGAPSCRTMPLGNLRELVFEGWLENARPEEVLSVFESCPALEKLVLNWVCFPAGLDGADIGRKCPNLRTFSCAGKNERLLDSIGPLGIMETLPDNRMEILDYYGGGYRCVDGIVAERTILRHSCSLRQINLSSSITSTAIQMILATCGVLEELHVTGSSIELSDAVAFPWAGSRMTRLTLDLKIVMQSAPETQYTPFYFQIPLVVPSAEENRIFAQLDVFYRQIGKQASLKYLSLSRIGYDEDGLMELGEGEHEEPMPGMLRLTGGCSSCGGMDRPGFLDLLGGLRQLEVLEGGAIDLETEDGVMPADAKEVDWIRTHWPLLRKTNFFFASRWPEENFSHL